MIIILYVIYTRYIYYLYYTVNPVGQLFKQSNNYSIRTFTVIRFYIKYKEYNIITQKLFLFYELF